MNPHIHIRHALAPFRPYLTTETFGQPGSGLLLGLALGALLLLWLLGVGLWAEASRNSRRNHCAWERFS